MSNLYVHKLGQTPHFLRGTHNPGGQPCSPFTPKIEKKLTKNSIFFFLFFIFAPKQKGAPLNTHLRTGTNGGFENRRGTEVTQPSRGWADTHSLVGGLNVEGVPVGVAVNGDGSNPEALGGPHDPARDFAPVGHQNLLYALRLRSRGGQGRGRVRQ